MTKMSDLENIRERKVLLQYIPRDGSDPLIMHISRRQGDVSPSVTYNLTNCGRVLDYSRVYTERELDLDNGVFIPCPRCGKPEDFQPALSEYWKWREEWDRTRAKQEAEEAAERIRQWNAYIRELERLQDMMNTAQIYPTVLDKKNGRLVIQTSEYEDEWLEVKKYRKG